MMNEITNKKKKKLGPWHWRPGVGFSRICQAKSAAPESYDYYHHNNNNNDNNNLRPENGCIRCHYCGQQDSARVDEGSYMCVYAKVS